MPSVNAAAVAFGAAYEANLLRKTSISAKSIAIRQYQNAIRSLRLDLQDSTHGKHPLLLACVLLAGAEVVQRDMMAALTHLKGAYQILSTSQMLRKALMADSLLVDSLDASEVDIPSDRPQAPGEDLVHLLRNLDLQAVTFSEGRVPDMPSLEPRPALPSEATFSNFEEGCMKLTRIIHNSYHFVATASKYRYQTMNTSLTDILIEQYRHASLLQSWLRCIDKLSNRNGYPHFDNTDPATQSSMICRALVLKTRCLSTLIFVSTVLDPYETKFDRFAHYFLEIIRCSKAVLETAPPQFSSADALPHFTISPGIIQPLVLVARKYRHSRHRREAMSLLRRAGIEGPWNGLADAIISLRVAQVEEELSITPSSPSLQLAAINPPYTPESDTLSQYPMSFSSPFTSPPPPPPHHTMVDILPTAISEENRICDLTVLQETLPDATSSPLPRRTPFSSPTTTTSYSEVIFSLTRCIDLDRIVSNEKPISDKSSWVSWVERARIPSNISDGRPSSNTNAGGVDAGLGTNNISVRDGDSEYWSTITFEKIPEFRFGNFEVGVGGWGTRRDGNEEVRILDHGIVADDYDHEDESKVSGSNGDGNPRSNSRCIYHAMQMHGNTTKTTAAAAAAATMVSSSETTIGRSRVMDYRGFTSGLRQILNQGL